MKNKIKRLTGRIVFPFVLLLIWIQDYFVLRTGKSILLVLCYHRVNKDTKDTMTVTPERFDHQIALLKRHYHVVSGNELEGIINEKQGFKGKKYALVTFDDGYEDNYTNALPILRKHSCPAIFLVATGYVNTEKTFEHDKEKYAHLKLKAMTWEQLKDASKYGISIGIHSDNHLNLGKIGFDTAKDEIRHSIVKYEKNLGKYPHIMAFPFGGLNDINEKVVQYIKQNTDIRVLFSANGWREFSPIDRYNINRIFIGDDDKGYVFRYRAEGGLRALLKKNGICKSVGKC